MTPAIVLGTLGLIAIFLAYSLLDKWMDGKVELMELEADRMRVENESDELTLEIRRDAYYGKPVETTTE